MIYLIYSMKFFYEVFSNFLIVLIKLRITVVVISSNVTIQKCCKARSSMELGFLEHSIFVCPS